MPLYFRVQEEKTREEPCGRTSGRPLATGRVLTRLVGGRALVAVQKLGQGRDLSGERGAALAGDAHPGAWLASLVALLDLDQARLLEHGQVPGQVARGQVERLAQVAEVGYLSLGGDGQDAQPVPLVDQVVDPVRRMRDRPPGVRVAGVRAGGVRAGVTVAGRRAAGGTHARACFRWPTLAAAPATRSTAAGSSRLGREVCHRSLTGGVQPSRNSRFSVS